MPLPDTLTLDVRSRVTGELDTRHTTHAVQDGVHTVKVSCGRGEFTGSGETEHAALTMAFTACGDCRETAQSTASKLLDHFHENESI
jgi:hypothetical protein